MRIESLHIKNYRALRDFRLGGVAWDSPPGQPLSNLVVVVGRNGSGKSTLFDAFAFLKDSLAANVRVALEKRGGFKELCSRESSGPVSFELRFRQQPDSPLATYYLEVAIRDNKPIVSREILKYRRGQHGQPWHFLDFENGVGRAIRNENSYFAGEENVKQDREPQQLESPDILAVKGLGQFQQFKIASEFRRLIENWHLSDFHVQAARPDQEISAATHLSTRGDNIASFARYMHEEHSERFQDVLKKLASRVPGIQTVSSQDTADGRIVLRFADGSFKDPFLARYVSDGTIRMFAYLLLLNDPAPHPLLCVEEPENQLYPELLEGLAEEFREYAEGGGQVFVSTHSPDFLDALRPSEVYLIKKDGGASTAIPIAQSASVNELVGLGDRLGSLLRQNALWELANR